MRILPIKTITGLLLILTACHSNKKAVQQAPVENKTVEATTPADTNYIVFLNLRISRDSILRDQTIEKIDVTRQAGQLKNNPPVVGDIPSYLVFEIYEKDQLVQTQSIEHPLFRYVEYMDKNNQLARIEMRTGSADFFIRFDMKGKEGKVKIKEKTKGNPMKDLATITL